MWRTCVITIAVLACVGWSKVSAVTGLATLLVIDPHQKQPRNSEGDIVLLADGRLCLIYTRFTDGSGDGSAADLAMRTSDDGGTTWRPDRIIVPNEGRNVMSVSVHRLKDSGELLLFYLRKDLSRDSCNLFVRRSADEFKTIGPAVRVTQLNGYHVVNNDRVIQLLNGRIIVPAVLHTSFDVTGTKVVGWDDRDKGLPFVYYSDDMGRTWHKDETVITPVPERNLTLQENGVVELKDGRLWMFMRTVHGFQYGCYSSDAGDSWSVPQPIKQLASPLSPASIKRIPWTGDLVCIWNDHTGTHPFSSEANRFHPAGKRNPLCVAVSKDEGRSWSKSKIIEGNPDGWFCYTSITFLDDRVLLTYNSCVSKQWCMNRLKVAALSKDWFDRNFYAATN